MENSTKKLGRRRGARNKEGHKAGGARKGAGRKKRMQLAESEGEADLSDPGPSTSSAVQIRNSGVCNKISTFLSL